MRLKINILHIVVSFIMFIVSTNMIVRMYTENTENCCEHAIKSYQSKSNYNDTNLFVMYRFAH